MKSNQLILIAITAIFITACNTTKKNATSTNAVTPIASTNSLVFIKPADGIYPPGADELAAIQVKYNDVTLNKLKEGHYTYTKGACVNCHGALNIYQYGEAQWKSIIDDMAKRANISDAEKDAVYKYVLAIKATQAK